MAPITQTDAAAEEGAVVIHPRDAPPADRTVVCPRGPSVPALHAIVGAFGAPLVNREAGHEPGVGEAGEEVVDGEGEVDGPIGDGVGPPPGALWLCEPRKDEAEVQDRYKGEEEKRHQKGHRAPR